MRYVQKNQGDQGNLKQFDSWTSSHWMQSSGSSLFSREFSSRRQVVNRMVPVLGLKSLDLTDLQCLRLQAIWLVVRSKMRSELCVAHFRKLLDGWYPGKKADTMICFLFFHPIFHYCLGFLWIQGFCVGIATQVDP